MEKMEHNGRLRLKQSVLTNLGSATDMVRESPSMLDAEHPLETELRWFLRRFRGPQGRDEDCRGILDAHQRSLAERFQQCIPTVLIELDVELGRHLIGEVEQLTPARNR